MAKITKRKEQAIIAGQKVVFDDKRVFFSWAVESKVPLENPFLGSKVIFAE